MVSATILKPLAPAQAVVCFPSEPNIPEGPNLVWVLVRLFCSSVCVFVCLIVCLFFFVCLFV